MFWPYLSRDYIQSLLVGAIKFRDAHDVRVYTVSTVLVVCGWKVLTRPNVNVGMTFASEHNLQMASELIFHSLFQEKRIESL